MDSATANNRNIEDRSITISLKMAWAIVVSLAVASLSIAGLYFGLQGSIGKVDSKVDFNKSSQTTTDAVQNLQLENIKLSATRTEIDLRDIKNSLEQKQDKKK